MNLKITKRVSPLMTVTALAISAMNLTGCGKSDGGGNVIAPPAPLPAPGIPGPVTPVGGGCVPINQPIPFTANNIYFDWANMVGGRIPLTNQQVGTVMTGGPIIQQGNLSRQGVDGTIVVNVQPGTAAPMSVPYPNYNPGYNYQYYGYNQFGSAPYSGNYGAKTANLQGTVAIDPTRQQDILWKFGNGGLNNNYFQFPSNTPYQYTPFPGYYYPGQPQNYTAPNPGSICVSQVAFDLGHWDSQGVIYGGRVYLYLNNTEHGYILWF